MMICVEQKISRKETIMKKLFLCAALLSTLGAAMAATVAAPKTAPRIAPKKAAPAQPQITIIKNGVTKSAIYVAPAIMAADVEPVAGQTQAQTDIENTRLA